MFCHQCGAGIEDPDDRFCSRCGAPLYRGEDAKSSAPGPASPLAEPPADRHRRPISAWPDRRHERIQLPLTELRQRRSRDAVEPVAVLPGAPPVAVPPPMPEPEVTEPAPPAAEISEIETVEPIEEEGPLSTSRSRAEAALRRMVPPKDEWADENRPGPAERTRVRDEWPVPAPSSVPAEGAAPPVPVEPPVAPSAPPAAPPPVDDPIIPWLEPPVAPTEPERPAPPSREPKPDEGPIIVPRDYTEKAARQRKGRRGSRSRGPLLDPAALGRSIKPSWILAIAGVILLTLIVFAIFPPGGGGDTTNADKVNRFTGMPIHTVATPVRPTPGTVAVVPAGVQANQTVGAIATDTPPMAEPTASQRPSGFGVLPGATTRATTASTTASGAAAAAGTSGIRVVVSSVGGWSGTIGQQTETYTETPVVGSGTQVRAITGPVTMITANIQKLDQTTDPLEVRVEQDGVVLKRGQTTEPSGIVALSVKV